MMVLSQATEPNRTPKIYFIRHGETAWTISGQHTGRSDIPLAARGERDAQELSAPGRGHDFRPRAHQPRCSGHSEFETR